MITIQARNVNDALYKGIHVIQEYGDSIPSRVGNTLEVPCPVATVYEKPWERVLINKERDANPFFHLMEALWVLAGRDDVKFLTEFNKRMADFSDDGETFNAPYGARLRNGVSWSHDQLKSVIKILKADRNSRQAVCQIWDESDLDHITKDKACNMSIVFRIRKDRLCMTVYNRSNDMIWGAYGANAVQFSMIQEYVAAHLDLCIGPYTQVSNSFHVYTDDSGGEVWNRIKNTYKPFDYLQGVDNYVLMSLMDMDAFDADLELFFKSYDDHKRFGLIIAMVDKWKSEYFRNLVLPVLSTYLIYKQLGAKKAIQYTDNILADDWRLGCETWLQNRIK
jgi:thymidylate synthase